MTNFHKKNSIVSWKWGRGKIEGHVLEIYHEPVEKEIKDTLVKRNAGKENPAYFIKESDKEAHVLKLHSELL